MAQKTAMHQMLDELMAHEYTIQIELIVKCKELIEVEKKQMIQFAEAFATSDAIYCSGEFAVEKDAEQYYNETYNK